MKLEKPYRNKKKTKNNKRIGEIKINFLRPQSRFVFYRLTSRPAARDPYTYTFIYMYIHMLHALGGGLLLLVPYSVHTYVYNTPRTQSHV